MWIIPAVIGLAVISMGIPMLLEYLSERKEDKNNDSKNNTNN